MGWHPAPGLVLAGPDVIPPDQGAATGDALATSTA